MSEPRIAKGHASQEKAQTKGPQQKQGRHQPGVDPAPHRHKTDRADQTASLSAPAGAGKVMVGRDYPSL